VFPLQHVLRERAAVLRYTYIAWLVAGEIPLLLVLIHQPSIKPSDTEDGFPNKLGMEDILKLNTGLESLH
jgi:hypothetical protein